MENSPLTLQTQTLNHAVSCTELKWYKRFGITVIKNRQFTITKHIYKTEWQ